MHQFPITYKGEKLVVERHSYSGNPLFSIFFPGKASPLVITKMRQAVGTSFWNSIPEGRQKEAEELGALIENYFHSIA
jgi:hypothetical protein